MRQRTRTTTTCKYCGKSFEVYKYSLKKGNGKFCSHECYIASRWGHTGVCANCGDPAKMKFCTPDCQKDYWNKRDKERLDKRKQVIWDEKKSLIERLGGKCARCGISDIRVLDINHIDPSKKLTPEKRQYSWSRRFKDWNANRDNIELLCANCHRIHTWNQMNYGKVNGKSI